jgi:hypothetical protein
MSASHDKSTAADGSGFEAALAQATAAIREGRPQDLPKVEYPWNSMWPAPEAPDFMWRAFGRWNRMINRLIRTRTDDPAIREGAAKDFPPPLDEQFIRWWTDVLYDKFVRETWDDMRLLMLWDVLRADDTEHIPKVLGDVLDKAGVGAPPWARIEASWNAIRASYKGEAKDDPIAYVRKSVGVGGG